MKKRRALLVGVPEYESDALEDLPVVRRDLEILHSTLENTGYGVRTIGTEGIDQTGQTRILKALRKALRDAKGLDVLLLYFSGHGMHFKGKDYLIPSDADFDYPDDPAFAEYLVATDDLHDAIDKCNAKTILFVVDACRHGVQLGVKDIGLTNWSQGEVRKTMHRGYVLVYACGPGQVSQYVSGEDGFSLLTQAFAQALDAQHPACSLSEVLEATQNELNSLVKTYGKRPQKIRRLLESEIEIEDDTLQRIICEGTQPVEEPGEVVAPWFKAVLETPLWPEESYDENSTAGQLKHKVIEIVDSCWQQWQATKIAFPQDAWRDENLPIRVLDRLDLLVSRSYPPIELEVAEIALIITVPFVREAVLAIGVFKAVEQCDPLAIDNENREEGFGLALGKFCQAQPRFIRKAKRLEEQGQTEEKDAVMVWLMHRCLLKSREVWQSASKGGYLSGKLDDILEGISTCQQRLIKNTLTKSRLLELSRCMFSNFKRIDRDNRLHALYAEYFVKGDSYRDEQLIREKLLAYLLHLGGLLAIDIRLLSNVITDNIGLTDSLNPQKLLETVAEADWKPTGQGRTLRTKSYYHPAAELALNEHVEYSETVLKHIFQKNSSNAPGLSELTGLPSHFWFYGKGQSYQYDKAIHRDKQVFSKKAPEPQENKLFKRGSEVELDAGNLLYIETEAYEILFRNEPVIRDFGYIESDNIRLFESNIFKSVCSYSLRELLEEFSKVIFSPSLGQTSFYNQSNNFKLETISLSRENRRYLIAFRIIFDTQNWKKSWSINEFLEDFYEYLSNSEFSFNIELSKRFSEDFEASYLLTLNNVLDNIPILETINKSMEVIYLSDTEAASNLSKDTFLDSVVRKFYFPKEVKSACEQYLLYFAEFLNDIGIEVTSSLTEEEESVILAVEPKDKEEALGNISELLRLYLQLPSSPVINAYQPSLDVSLPAQKLNAQVLHLQSQLTLANAERQYLNSTIQQKDILIAQQAQMIHNQKFTTQVLIDSLQRNEDDEENLVGKLVRVKDYEAGPLAISLPELLRQLKEWVKRS